MSYKLAYILEIVIVYTYVCLFMYVDPQGCSLAYNHEALKLYVIHIIYCIQHIGNYVFCHSGNY